MTPFYPGKIMGQYYQGKFIFGRVATPGPIDTIAVPVRAAQADAGPEPSATCQVHGPVRLNVGFIQSFVHNSPAIAASLEPASIDT